MGKVEVNEARNDVVENFNSGAKVDELGGVGSERVPKKPSPSPARIFEASAPSVVSSLFNTTSEGLGVLLGGP